MCACYSQRRCTTLTERSLLPKHGKLCANQAALFNQAGAFLPVNRKHSSLVKELQFFNSRWYLVARHSASRFMSSARARISVRSFAAFDKRMFADPDREE